MFERIKVPFIFVPHGKEPDPAARARFSDPIRVPARFVPRKVGSVRFQPEPIGQDAARDAASQTVAGDGGARDEAVLGSGEADAGGLPWASPAHDPAQADAIGDYLRMECFLAQAGFTNSVERRNDGGVPDTDTIFPAPSKTPGGTQGTHSDDRLAAASVSGGYVAENPRQWSGHPSVGTGECVPLVRQATGAPLSTLWRPGPVVKGNTAIRPGTAIATFDSSGHYKGHAAIYLGQNQTGIQVVDQWNVRHEAQIVDQHQPSERTIGFHNPRSARVDQGESYYVVE